MLNVVAICGRLTADPELRATQNGTTVTSFTIAVDGRTKDSNTDFINCVAWRKTAEFITSHFHKGKMIIISGRLQTRTYTTQNGEKRHVTEVIAEQVYFAGDNAKVEHSEAQEVATSDFAVIDGDNGDLPF